MKIGIIGNGVVGQAIGAAFAGMGHAVSIYDIDPVKSPANLADVAASDLAFVCVPTPGKGGELDISAVWQAILDLRLSGSNAVIAIKSTVPVGFTDSLPIDDIAFTPEFLSDDTAFDDAARPGPVIVGTRSDRAYSVISAAYAGIGDVMRVAPKEAEIIKLATNTYYAAKVVFHNIVYDLARAHGADYEAIKSVLATDKRIGDSHNVIHHKGYRGYGGKCLPKDAEQFRACLGAAGISSAVIDAVIEYNRRLRDGA
ncbi:MAG: hypothetical protein PHT33_03910 [bacterium]|nr:hypothetical protein [bacterium]